MGVLKAYAARPLFSLAFRLTMRVNDDGIRAKFGVGCARMFRPCLTRANRLAALQAKSWIAFHNAASVRF